MNIFQGVRISMIIHLKNQNAPLMIGVHYMNHHTNLVIYTLSKLNIVGKIENVL